MNYDRLTLWDVEVYGKVYRPRVVEGKPEVELINENGEPFRRMMACYWNLGRDAEITFRVDEAHSKTGSRFGNNFKYV